MAKGSKIGRIREYFRTGDLDEVQVVLQLVNQDVAARAMPTQGTLPFVRTRRAKRTRKSTAEPADHATAANSTEAAAS